MDTDESLTDFLLARIAEDERLARAASLGNRRAINSGHRWTRMLAECEAKRRIVADLTDSGHATPDADDGRILAFLALPYADHPDYQEAWRA